MHPELNSKTNNHFEQISNYKSLVQGRGLNRELGNFPNVIPNFKFDME